MARLRPEEWAVFLDHDAMILCNDFWSDLAHAIAAHPDAGAIVCWTNRTGNARQKAKAPPGDDIRAHTMRAQAIRREYGQALTDVTGSQMTGVLFAVSRAAWDKAGPFRDGFGGVDNSWAHQCVAAGLRLWRMDGVYVYHQRRTNGWKGATRPEMDCRGAQWAYRRASPIMAEHGSQTVRDLARQHAELVEGRTDWSDCQKSARRKALLSHWRASMRVSVVIPSREEEREELRATVESFRAAGAHEVVVIDDGTARPVEGCGATVVIRHDVAQGVAASRNEGLRRATGNVVVFSDSHCRVADGCSLSDWAYEAYCSEELICAVCGSYENAETWYYGCSLPWRDWRFDVSANRQPTDRPAGVFGSVYAAARWTWDRLGGWVPTQGWGYNEQALSLACHHAAVPIRVHDWFRIRHKFRNDKKFPYAVSGKAFAANAPWVHWLLFGDDVWAVFNAATRRHNPEADRWFRERVNAEAKALRDTYRGLGRTSDLAVLAAIGAHNLCPNSAKPATVAATGPQA